MSSAAVVIGALRDKRPQDCVSSVFFPLTLEAPSYREQNLYMYLQKVKKCFVTKFQN